VKKTENNFFSNFFQYLDLKAEKQRLKRLSIASFFPFQLISKLFLGIRWQSCPVAEKKPATTRHSYLTRSGWRAERASIFSILSSFFGGLVLVLSSYFLGFGFKRFRGFSTGVHFFFLVVKKFFQNFSHIRKKNDQPVEKSTPPSTF
jgi:hypothetical protein